MNNKFEFNIMADKYRFLILFVTIALFFAPNIYAIESNVSSVHERQQLNRKISGKVSDKSGDELIGVTVLEKGTENGTITDIDGTFNLTLSSSNPVLIFSYVGFTTLELPVSDSRDLNVTLQEDITGLDEVVVVGYGTQKKATLTGSISQVGGDELKKVSAANLSNTLAGKTAGVIANTRSGEPGEDGATILIRGKGTTGNTSPLIVVDGIADRGFSRLNPEDIESISILKDASAAIYGARAANGVILVTTKRGKEGKVKFNYSGNYTWSQPTRVPDMLNSYQYATYVNEYDARHGASTPTYSAEAIEKLKDGSDPINYGNTNWWDAIAKNWSERTHHSLAVSGGNDRVAFYTSAQYMWQDAIYKNSPQDYGQYQFTTNIDTKINESVRFSVDILGRQEVRNRGVYATDYLFGKLLQTNPIVGPYYPNGLVRAGFDGLGNNAAIMVSDAPGTNKYTYNILNLKPKLRVDMDFVTKGLYAEGYAALDFTFDNGKQMNNPYDVFEYDPSIDEYKNRRSETGSISLSSWSANSHRYTLNGRLGYVRNFDDTHKIDAFVAYEQATYKYNYLSAYRTNFLSTAIPEIFAGSSNPEDWGTGGYGAQTARQNYFGRINYSYMDKYLAEVTMRYDGSMNFPKNKRWGAFPGASVGWVMSEESFYEPLKDYVSFFKLKTSFGLMGNDNIAAYQYLSRYLFLDGGVMFGDAVQKGLYESVTANPNVTWETAKTFNVGFNSQFLNNKLNLDFDYFYSRRNNILRTRSASIPDYAGLVLPAENIGKVENQGIELVVGYRDRVGDLNWGVNANFTFAENKVLYIDEASSIPEWQKSTGYPIDALTMYKAIGIYQSWDEVNSTPHISGAQPGDLIYYDTNDDGIINWDDAIRHNESPTPKILYGFTINSEYKGIDLNIFFQGQAKAHMIVQPTMNMMTDFYEGRWIQPLADEGTAEYNEQVAQNLNARWPGAFIKQTYGDELNGSYSTWWLKNASFLRLKSVELGYTLPKKASLVQKMGIESCRFYANGANLFTLDRIKTFDPEISYDTGWSNANGISAYPLQRTVTVGVNITF